MDTNVSDVTFVNYESNLESTPDIVLSLKTEPPDTQGAEVNLTDFDTIQNEGVATYKMHDNWDTSFLRITINAYSGIAKYDLLFTTDDVPTLDNYENRIKMTHKDHGQGNVTSHFTVLAPTALGFRGENNIIMGITPVSEGMLVH